MHAPQLSPAAAQGAADAARPVEPALRYALLPSAAHREVAGEIFVISADRGFHRLQAASAVTLFRLLAAGPRTAAELEAALVGEFEVDPQVAHHDIAEFLLILVERQIAAAVQPTLIQAESV